MSPSPIMAPRVHIQSPRISTSTRRWVYASPGVWLVVSRAVRARVFGSALLHAWFVGGGCPDRFGWPGRD
jgi:hypothetical protein